MYSSSKERYTYTFLNNIQGNNLQEVLHKRSSVLSQSIPIAMYATVLKMYCFQKHAYMHGLMFCKLSLIFAKLHVL